jgi:hypothetical protein
VLGAPQVPDCHGAVAVSVSPENPATICVPMQRPPVSLPRVYSARISLSKVM